MNNTIYRRVVVSARQSADGETPTEIVLTQELNCLLLWFNSCHGRKILDHFHDRDRAIEAAVDAGRLPRHELFRKAGINVEDLCRELNDRQAAYNAMGASEAGPDLVREIEYLRRQVAEAAGDPLD